MYIRFELSDVDWSKAGQASFVPPPMRDQYLNSLGFAQEYFIEEQVRRGRLFLIHIDDSLAGYYIECEKILLEFFVSSHYRSNLEEIFEAVLSHTKMERIYCKSFDSLLLKCCIRKELPYKAGGILFREYGPNFTTVSGTGDFKVRWAETSDREQLSKFDDLADSPDELERMIEGRNLNLFYSDETLIGCGYIFRIINGRNWFDIGMWVHPDLRGRGYAKQIVNYQKGFCLENDFSPVCGCAAGNIASKKVLEACGFIASHDLIVFDIS